MSDVTFVGQILLFPFNFAPTGFALCDGKLLPILQNTALFSLIGTFYGGNGVTHFALPDLRGRAPVAFGQGPGPSQYDLGAAGGSETIALAESQMPAHTHEMTNALKATARARNGTANQRTPQGNVPAIEATGVTATYSDGAPDASMNAGAITLSGSVSASPAGGNQAHENRQPYLVLNYCIALQGVFPPRP